MTAEQISGYILICLMMGIVFLATRFVCGVRYNGRGIYFITINAWFRHHEAYREWLRGNKVYHWCILLVIMLCVTILFLIPPFSQGKMLVRPELSIYTNVALWLAILFTYRWFFNKINSLK